MERIEPWYVSNVCLNIDYLQKTQGFELVVNDGEFGVTTGDDASRLWVDDGWVYSGCQVFISIIIIL